MTTGRVASLRQAGAESEDHSELSVSDACRVAVMGVVFALVLSLALSPRADAQQMRYMTGQNVVPVFEGWEPNADGSISMVFGYMNRNYEEEVDVPVGPENRFEPLDADQGQPAHFYPRRQQFMFKVRVPKDWGQKDLVWTLTSHGKTEKAYGTLMPVWQIDSRVYQQNRGGPGELNESDGPPAIALTGPAQRTVTVGQPVALDVRVTDDGMPTPRATRSGSGGAPAAPPKGLPTVRENPLTQAVVRLEPNVRLGVTWVVHRRSVPASVEFDAPRVPVVDGKAAAVAKFTAPGIYTLRGYADDGVLLDYADVVITVQQPH
jgi:hypothetical protein